MRKYKRPTTLWFVEDAHSLGNLTHGAKKIIGKYIFFHQNLGGGGDVSFKFKHEITDLLTNIFITELYIVGKS